MKSALFFSLLALPSLLTVPAVSAEAAPEPASVVEPQASPDQSFDFIYLSDPRGILVYAYRMADSAPLPEAELHLLDGAERRLVTCSLKNGIAQGELPAETRYLQLCCGKESRKVAVRDRIARPHPDAPNCWAHRTSDFRFLDRRSYRPGEKVRMAGIRRDIKDGVFYYPQNRQLVLEYELPGKDGLEPHRLEIPLAEDGTWLAEFTLPPDMQGMKDVALYELVNSHGGKALFLNVQIEESPQFSLRVDGALAVQERQLESSVRVSSVDGQALPGSELLWSLEGVPGLVMPEGYEDYFFGEGRPYMVDARLRQREYFMLHRRSKLDAEGRSHVSFTMPWRDFPQRMELILKAKLSAVPSPGNTVHQEKLRVEAAELSVGLRRRSAYSKPGEELPIDLVLVRNSGCRYEGEPVEVEVLVRRHEFVSDRLGEQLHDGWRSRDVSCHRQMLPAEGATLSLRLEQEGAYDIIVHGRDTAGNVFASSVRQYVWAKERAPWLRDVSGRVELSTRKGYYGSSYREGDRVQLFTPSPMEGTAIIVIEGDEKRYVLTQPVLAGQRAISFPMLAEYGASPTVTWAVVQGAGPRPMHGRPMLQLGEFPLSVKTTAAALDVQLAEAPSCMKAGEQWNVTGCVRDAEGKPVPGATVLLCAKDVGAVGRCNGGSGAGFVMQEKSRGLVSRLFMDAGDVPSLPNPRSFFSGQRRDRFSSSFNRVDDADGTLAQRNEFVYHPAFGEYSGAAPEPRALRGCASVDGVAPEGTEAALWMRVSTDEQGRFSTPFTAPNENTEIQLFALACARPEQFGVAGWLVPIALPELE